MAIGMHSNGRNLYGTRAERLTITSASPFDEFYETDYAAVWQWTGSVWRLKTESMVDSNPAAVRNVDTTNNYSPTKHEANSNILQSVTTAQSLGAGAPIFLMGLQIRTALTGTLTITGFNDTAGVATSWVLPIGSVGSILPPGNARRMDNGCTMTLSVGTDGPFVVVDWRPI